MKPILIGYTVKKRELRSAWVSPYPEYPDATFPAPPSVEEICSVSNCIAADFEDRSLPYVGNEFCLYTRPGDIWNRVPEALRDTHSLYAYAQVPTLFDGGKEVPLSLPRWAEDPERSNVPEWPGFEPLGWDVAERSPRFANFGCSPLSCNHMASNPGLPRVNRFCLMDREEDALTVARSFSITKPEPGPFVVVRVWRWSGSQTGS